METSAVGKIKNKNELATTDIRRDALAIAEAGLWAIDTKEAVRKNVRIEGNMLHITNGPSFSLSRRVFVVGVGKCAIRAAEALEEILGPHIAGGVVLDVAIPEVCTLKKIKCASGTHPLPSDENIVVTHEIVDTLERLGSHDVVMVIVSGGGSTLLCMPGDKKTCVEERTVVDLLMRAGATIEELNTVRQHLSLARGGGLAKFAYPATVVGLVFSDVPSNDLHFIASGPTVRVETTKEDAVAILKKYNILQKAGLATVHLFDTPQDEQYFKKVYNKLIVSNEIALSAMASEATGRGYTPTIVSSKQTGEATRVGEAVGHALLRRPPGTVLLYGGETTVTVGEAMGTGGRNQELALAALALLSEGSLVLALASDGRDNTDAAGALADGIVSNQAEEKKLLPKDFLARHDSNTFFRELGAVLVCGPTGSNVSDLTIALRKK
jgi:glycerate-2-kinase